MRKKTLEKTESPVVQVNARAYRVDGEVGRFCFETYRAYSAGTLIYDSSRELFPELKSKEYYRTCGFKELAIAYGDLDLSFRKTAQLINRIRHQEEGGTPSRTLHELTEKEGSYLLDHIRSKAESILHLNDFTSSGEYQGVREYAGGKDPEVLSEEQVARAVSKCLERCEMDAEASVDRVCYEDPKHTVNISIDDVNTKRQKEKRKKVCTGEKAKRKYVRNTIIHVEKADRNYILNGTGIKPALCFLLAFLLNNNLLCNRLQFFVDGHRLLVTSLLEFFSWFSNIGILLDWYHLEKKCRELLSMSLNGKIVRNEILEQLMPLLWHGMTDKAQSFLENIEKSSIRNETVLKQLIDYLERNKPYIPSYAVRKELGLRNSSGIGEKTNDLIVSARQKHNGMSWSKPGSVALATLSAQKRNGEITKWFEDRTIDFEMTA